jgi:hypothetical protein
MNWIPLKEPPKDLSNYIRASELNTPEQTELNLRGLIKQGTLNIMAIRFDVSIIKNLETEIIKTGYRVQFVPSEIESYASFYLAKFTK